MKRRIGLFLALLLPITFVLIWKHTDQQYPRNDDSFYMVLTQELYTNFSIHPISKSLEEIYFHKHWKPVLHPVAAVPILLATGGDTRMAIDIYTVAVFATLLSLIFLYLNRSTGPIAAGASTVMIAFIPWVFGLSTGFNSELGFVTATVAFFYVFTRRSILEDRGTAVCAAILMALMASLRPVESALLFTVPILAGLTQAFINKKISSQDLVYLAIWLILLAGTLLPPFFLMQREWSGLQVLLHIAVAALYLFVLYKKIRSLSGPQQNFHTFFGIVFCLTIFWFLPGARTLFDWIFLANFQSMAIETGNRFGRPLSDFVIFYFEKLGIAFWILLGFALIFHLRQFLLRLLSVPAMTFVCGILLFPFFAGALSYNGDVRYYYAGWMLLLLVLIAHFFRPDQRFFRTKLTIIITFTALLLWNLAHQFNPSIRPLPHFFQSKIGGSFFDLQPKRHESARTNYERIASEMTLSKNSLRTLTLFHNTPDYFIDAWQLGLNAVERGKIWEFHAPNMFDPSPAEAQLPYLRSADYILVGPAEQPWDKKATGLIELSHEFLQACRHNADENVMLYNFSFKATIITENTSGKPGTYCLFENISPPPDFKGFH